jgi:hypothetical protein
LYRQARNGRICAIGGKGKEDAGIFGVAAELENRKNAGGFGALVFMAVADKM